MNFLFSWRIAAIVFIAGVLLSGWGAHVVTRNIENAKYLALEKSFAEANQKTLEIAAEKMKSDRRIGDAIALSVAKDEQIRQLTFKQIRKDAQNVKENLRSAGHIDYQLSIGWLSNYNAALSVNPSAPPKTTIFSVNSPQRARTDSGVTEWQVLDNVIDNFEGYAACRGQLNALITWVESTSDD